MAVRESEPRGRDKLRRGVQLRAGQGQAGGGGGAESERNNEGGD